LRHGSGQLRRQVKTVRKIDYNNMGENSDTEDEVESHLHRNKRGLKTLSVKVRKLVHKLGRATYSNVAN
jgi:hypothetical protein